MMLEEVLSRVFHPLRPGPDAPLIYTATLNGTRFAVQWTYYIGRTPEGLHEFLFLLELDPAAIGQGGSPIRQRSRLVCDEALRPVRYHTQTAGVVLGLDFACDEVRVDMPDGSKQTVPRGGAEFVIEANMSGQQALFLALAHARGQLRGEAHFTAFVVNSLLPTPYSTTPAPDLGAGWLRSSHQEELLLDQGGVVQLSRTPEQAIEVRRQPPASDLPASPAWRDEEVLRLDRPTYTPPPGAAFRLEEAEVPGPVTPLGATLSIPPGAGPFPAVLFLSGSGSHDRHGISGEVDLGSHEIVDHLAGAGFLGLRYDTRGAGRTRIGDDALEQGLLSIVADARAALAWLRGRPEVDQRRVFLVGHSQGGTVALSLAGEDAGLAGVALLAAMGRGIDELILDQQAQHCARLGLSAEQTEAMLQRQREFFALVDAEKPWVAGEVPDYLFTGARSRKWVLEHLRNRGTDLIKKVRCPVLVCQGEKDFQVSPHKDAERLVQAAREAGVRVTYALLPGLDHLFKPVPGDESRITDYYDRSRHVDRGFLDLLTRWLLTGSV